jgi:hypothetical protein
LRTARGRCHCKLSVKQSDDKLFRTIFSLADLHRKCGRSHFYFALTGKVASNASRLPYQAIDATNVVAADGNRWRLGPGQSRSLAYVLGNEFVGCLRGDHGLYWDQRHKMLMWNAVRPSEHVPENFIGTTVRRLVAQHCVSAKARLGHGPLACSPYWETKCQNTITTKPPSTTKKRPNRIERPQTPMKRANTPTLPSIRR